MKVESFSDAELERLSRALGEAATGPELTRIFTEMGLVDTLGAQATKWKRIHQAVRTRQAQDRCANNVIAFLKAVMHPVRFVNDPDYFDDRRHQVNLILAFKGLELLPTGHLKMGKAATTISEAEEKAGRLRTELSRRKVHPDVLTYCRAELVEENYFHAILEATKSVAQKLRDRTGSREDGAKLVDAVLSLSAPLLTWSQLAKESERSEHTGFASLLKGMFSMFRNPTAHEPKVLKSYTEDEALDLLTLVSFLHRRIDIAHRTTFVP